MLDSVRFETQSIGWPVFKENMYSTLATNVLAGTECESSDQQELNDFNRNYQFPLYKFRQTFSIGYGMIFLKKWMR